MEDEGTRRGPSAALSLQSGTTSFMLPAMGESLLKSRQTTSPQPGRLKTALKVLLVARRAIDPLTISSMMQNKIRLRIFYWTKQYYASAIKALEVDSSTSPPAAVKAGLRRYAIKQAQKQLLDSWVGFWSSFLWLIFVVLNAFLGCQSLASTEDIPRWYGVAVVGFVFAAIIKLLFWRVPSKAQPFV